MYGSSFRWVILMPRDSRIAPSDAAAMPFPSEDTTPPVTKTYLVIEQLEREIQMIAEFVMALNDDACVEAYGLALSGARKAVWDGACDQTNQYSRLVTGNCLAKGGSGSSIEIPM